jgi:hypothetical protein
MRLRAVTRRGLALIVTLFACQVGLAQIGGGAQALKEYEDTVRQADAQVSPGYAFEAVRLYERTRRVAYNNKLGVDVAALNAKLAAALSTRDAKSAIKRPTVPTATAKAATWVTPSASAVPPAPSGGATGEAEDANAWLRFGDSLAAASEYIDAVRDYERRRRLAVNNRLPLDRAALDAKIAAAAQARDALRPSPALIPEPLPPLPREPGTEPGLRRLRDRPGKPSPWTALALCSKAELKALNAKLHKVMDVLACAPVLSPPMGFEFSIVTILNSFEDGKERQRYIATRLPVSASINFVGLPYLEMRLRSKSSGAMSVGVGAPDEVSCVGEIVVNIRPGFEDGTDGDRVDVGDDTFVLEPKKCGELDGVPGYNDTMIFTRTGAVLWTPVSAEQALKALIPKLKSAVDTAAGGSEGKKTCAEFMSPEAQDKRGREVVAQSEAGAEANARKLEVMQRRWEEDVRKAAEGADAEPRDRDAIEAYRNAQTRLALDATGRAAPAYIALGAARSSPFDWRVVPIDSPGCRPLVQRNNDLFSAKLPPGEPQVLYVPEVTMLSRWLEARKIERNQPGDCVATARILRQTQWHELVGLLAH